MPKLPRALNLGRSYVGSADALRSPLDLNPNITSADSGKADNLMREAQD